MSEAKNNKIERWLHRTATQALALLPLITLPVCLVYLQGYSLQFWSGLLGAPGWGVSLGLELLHLWFWSRSALSKGVFRFGWGLMAAAATLLLLAGAMQQMTRPYLEAEKERAAISQMRMSLKAEAEVIKQNLGAYRKMAADQGRRGWQEDIRRETTRLLENTEKLRQMSTPIFTEGDAPNQMLSTVADLMLWVVVAVALLFQGGVILSVWCLTAALRSVDVPVSSSPKQLRIAEKNGRNISSYSENFSVGPKGIEQAFFKELWGRIEVYALHNRETLAGNNGKITQAALVNDLGIKAPDLSAIKYLGTGEEVERRPARASVEILADKFGLKIPG